MFWIRGNSSSHSGFSQKLLTLHPSFALTNVHQSRIDYLETPGFTPRTRRFPKRSLPILRYLALRELGRTPSGDRIPPARPQTLDIRATFREEPADDLALIPPFAPPLRVGVSRGRIFQEHSQPLWGSLVPLHGSFQRGCDSCPHA